MIHAKKTPLSQKGIVIWLLGLSGAGKSTIATLLKEKLDGEGFFSVLLDGDILRAGINSNLTYSNEDRAENVRRAAEMAKILVENNIITICSFITPMQGHRDLTHEILGERYFEVFVDCPLEVCEERDVKGLYKKARTEGLTNFTGISSAFEPSINSHLTLFTNTQTPRDSCELLYSAILPDIKPD
ncbi:MAG: adenylyl-sulfate kinase [Dyadobacter sp.]|uniref:adenylyl-sulfate kinase n=1 Tax=Dyadobacter sp. TaxID=1914288 RepID=UPI003267E4E4